MLLSRLCGRERAEDAELVAFGSARMVHDSVQANQIALGAARRLGDLAAQAWTCHDLGGGYRRQGHFEEALACLHESAGTGQWEALTVGGLVIVLG